MKINLLKDFKRKDKIMKTRTINIYEFSELSEGAKENALRQYRESQTEVFWMDKTIQSLKSLFENCNGISLKDWSLGEYQSWIRVEFTNDEVEKFSGKRAMAWIENNLLSNIRISYYGNKRKELRQYGKYYYAGLIKPCPFTGYCADDDLLDDLLKEIKSGTDLKTAFEGLASIVQKIIQNEWEYQQSEEYIAEYFEANEYKFDEDGNII